MATTVQKWGNSLAVRLPKAFADQIDLTAGSEVTIECADGIISIRPARKRRRAHRERPTLKSLLAQFKPEHRHGEIDRSGPVGKELI